MMFIAVAHIISGLTGNILAAIVVYTRAKADIFSQRVNVSRPWHFVYRAHAVQSAPSLFPVRPSFRSSPLLPPPRPSVLLTVLLLANSIACELIHLLASAIFYANFVP
eukprot:gnl/TRDRNA2_/TRDRNA2_174585_c1_seq5.p1 gnl/TRDRNA2_/TRDRNA2_174585_c1~~gnl/TRDRNA2_/TRDRNA2_174585_c1_seq5.p1  ORF type:complete len:108 (+),score=2.09 gnl/TRDRNA2_/TRDRNA2_174585_c1_seq5:27-350(+)